MFSVIDSSAGGTPARGAQASLPRGASRRPTSVALVGAHGHGASHLRRIAGLVDMGVAELCAIADPRPLDATDAPDGLGALDAASALAPWYSSLEELLAKEDRAPDVVVLSTPLPTHLPLAEQALRAGCDVLLEKPTAVSFAEYERIVAIVEETGRRCQVGFQSFGSHAFAEIDRIVGSGEIGEVTGIGAVGTWVRTAGYWTRAPWAGRRRLDGAEVVDGVLTNPLAHAVATALRVGGVTRAADVDTVDIDLYRANPIEADDTSSVRIVSVDGQTFGCGLTLCASERSPARILVQGTRGELTLYYETDRIEVLTSRTQWSLQSNRTDLLEDLLSARRDPAARLCCDVRDTGAFMRVLDAVRTAPDPALIASTYVTWFGEDTARRPVVHDVEAWCERAARTQSTFRTLLAPWSRRTTDIKLSSAQVTSVSDGQQPLA
jgi:predicted dehydrogenase